MIELRPYQRDAIQTLRDRLREGIKSLVLVLPTGGGKTVIAASVMHGALKNGSRLLFIAHRRELLSQCYQKMLDFDVPERELGIIMSDGKIRLRNGKLIKASRKDAPIQIASIDTLRHRAKPEADIIFIDECFPAGTYVDSRPIEMIVVGDKVRSWNETTGVIELKTVTHVFRTKPRQMVRVSMKSAPPIVCTGGHPFYTQRGYVPAIELMSEDVLYSHCDGDELTAAEGVDCIEVLERGRDGTFGGVCSDGHVYNLEVEDNHNYFAEGVLVHNCHRCLSKSYLDLKAAYPDAIHLGLTATPFRIGGKGLGSYYQDLVIGATPSILIGEGFIISPHVWTVSPEELPDLSNVKTQNGDYKEDDLAEACNTRKLVGSIVEHWKRHAEGRRTIVFPVNIEHSRHIVEDFRAAGIRAEHLDGTTKSEERDAILARLDRGETQVVGSVGVLCLDDQTEILTDTGWVGIDAMLPTHRVANWENGSITFEPPLDIIRRSRMPDERMVSVSKKSRRLNLRVTEGHGIVYRSASHSSWMKKPARELVDFEKEFPVSGKAAPCERVADSTSQVWTEKKKSRWIIHNKWNIIHLEGMDPEEARVEAHRRLHRKMSLRVKNPHELSLVECAFIGFWLGDGNVQKLQNGGVEYRLFESSYNAWIVKWLDELIASMDVDFIKRTLEPDEKSSELKYRRTHACFAWSFPRGTGGGSQERRGLFKIEPYLCREGSDLYWGFNDAQFEALLRGLWLADGDHGQGSDVLPSGIRIHNARKALLDRIQAIAACRGYRTRLRPESQEGMWRLAIRKNQEGVVIGNGYRLAFENDFVQERVWCVRTRTGNIVTRREGAVMVMGNCEGFDMPSVKCAILARPTKSTGLYLQMAGRILRPWNDTSAVILDHAGCVLEHGSPSEDREFQLQDTKIRRKSGESTKTCLGCYAIVETFHKTCPACGQEFPIKPRSASGERGVEHVDGTLIEYSDEEKERDRRDYWNSLCKLASENNYKSGWAKHRFKEKFGHYPPKSYPVPVGRPMTQGEKDVLRAKLTALAGKRNLPSGWVDRKLEEQSRTSRAPEIPTNLLGIGVTNVPSSTSPVSSTVHADPQKTLFQTPKSTSPTAPTSPAPTLEKASPAASSSNVGRWEV